MTMWGKFFRRPPALATSVETWDTPDGDVLTIVRVDADRVAPRLIVLHGLEGSYRSHYVGGILAAARGRGWGADLLIFRTCDGGLNRVRRTYHSGETSDVDLVVRRVAHEYPDAPLGLVGVSLGGNVALKWLGEQGSSALSLVRAAVAVSVPFDLAKSSRQIDRGISRLYSRNFLRSLRTKALAKIDKYPDLASRAAVRSAKTLWEFDDAFTSVAHGFSNAAEYYSQSSSMQFLSAIRVPTLLLSARDDPFHPPDLLDDVSEIARRNSCLTPEFPERGGHVGFVEGSSPRQVRYYIDRRVADFCAPWLAGNLRTQDEAGVNLDAGSKALLERSCQQESSSFS
jgi:uncharacterized protein